MAQTSLINQNLDFVTDGVIIYVFDANDENKICCEVAEFMDWLILNDQPYSNSGIKRYIDLTPKWKIISNLIQFDQSKI